MVISLCMRKKSIWTQIFLGRGNTKNIHAYTRNHTSSSYEEVCYEEATKAPVAIDTG